ncbi:MAG: phytanoyl-CoA dioxygenase, partial [Flavobacteriales bacterium]
MLTQKLRKYKLFYSIYNFFKKKELQHNIELYRKYGINKKYYSPVNSRDFEHLGQHLNWLDEGDSKKLLPENDLFNELDPTFQESLLNWSDNGYAVLRG